MIPIIKKEKFKESTITNIFLILFYHQCLQQRGTGKGLVPVIAQNPNGVILTNLRGELGGRGVYDNKYLLNIPRFSSLNKI